MKKLMIVICGLFFFPFKEAHALKSNGIYNVRMCSYYSTHEDINPYTSIDMSLNGTNSRKGAEGVFADWTHVGDLEESMHKLTGVELSSVVMCLQDPKCQDSNHSRLSSTVFFQLGQALKTNIIGRMYHAVVSKSRRKNMSEMLGRMMSKIMTT